MGQIRVVISAVSPTIDGGRYPVKRALDEPLRVTAIAVVDGHDRVTCRIQHTPPGPAAPRTVAMSPTGRADEHRGTLTFDVIGRHGYRVEAFVDRYETWRRDAAKRAAAEKLTDTDRLEGAELIGEAAENADEHDAEIGRLLRARADALVEGAPIDRVLDDELSRHMARFHPARFVASSAPYEVVVEPVSARFTSWYELFPRSFGDFGDVAERLDYVASMGFDTLYLPPIHPIGRTARKGKNNSPTAEPGDVGSPWGIGAAEGGHDAFHPDLGTERDFAKLVSAARDKGIAIALDLAFQCSPDHPYVKAHPDWFQHRADGSIRCAENPPKVYQDVYPLDFETDDWESLWNELLRVVRVWVERGVTVFRVDNPHTKPFAFWEWLIAKVKADHPEVLFLAEAFARPNVMFLLSKLGFSQSYNYFPWKLSKWDIREHYSEITRGEPIEYFRASSWPNTPDILTEFLQYGGRPAFVSRLIAAATLSASYGIYGPAFELCEARAVRPGSEEYLDSEKYQTRSWDLDAAESLRDLVARINRIRRENPALQRDRGLVFHETSSDAIVCYSKRSMDGDNVILTALNCDPHHKHSARLSLNLEALGVEPETSFQVHELLGDARFLWQGASAFVELDPHESPGHVYRLRRKLRTEENFEYFL